MFNMGEFICRNTSNDIALVGVNKNGDPKKYSYFDLDKYSNRAANMLISMGIKKGDRVVVCAEKNPYLIFMIIGILKVGAIYSPIFTSSGTESFNQKIEDCKPKIIVTQKYLLKKMQFLTKRNNHINIIIMDEDMGDVDLHYCQVLSIKELSKFDYNFEDYSTLENDIAIIHYTSGTTSKPKGVVHIHKAIKRYKYTMREVFGLSKQDMYWCTANHAWVTGSTYGILGPLSIGATTLVLEPGYRAAHILDALEKYNIKIWYTAPTLLRMLMREKHEVFEQFENNYLKNIYCVGEPLNVETIQWVDEKFSIIPRDTWFQTETGSIIIANGEKTKVKFGSMGRPLNDVEVTILDDNYKPVVGNVAGNLCIKKNWESMFIDYWNNEDVYNEKFEGEWYITGDIAYCDEDGYYWFKSRADEIINTAGHLVSPFEVENSIIKHPLIQDVAVFGVKDSVLGEKVVAFVIMKNNTQLTNSIKMQIKRIVRQEVMPFAVPQNITRVNEFPKTNSGKISRRTLRKMEERAN